MTEPAILTLQIPNPFFEGRNCVYLIRSDPPTLIDTGVATERAFEALVAGLAEHRLSIEDIGRVVLTHKHIDHIGNAWRIQQAGGAELFIHESEADAVSQVDPEGTHFQDLVRERMRVWNLPEEAAPKPQSAAGFRWEIEPAKAQGLVDGQQIELGSTSLVVLHTPGHTKGSICLEYGRRLFSGDHVLPDISPNVGGGDMRRRGLLQDFLTSLERVAERAGQYDQVLPGHGEPFVDLAGRCQSLIAHHHQRLDQIVKILERRGPLHVYEMAQILFGEMRDFHVILGCAEAQAHLDFLVDDGRAQCDQQLLPLVYASR